MTIALLMLVFVVVLGVLVSSTTGEKEKPQ